MDVRQAQAFIAVAEELNFGRAAARLHLGQSPLSRLIRQLERELGADLFARTTHRVDLTEHGRAVLGPARELVLASKRIDETIAASLGGAIGTVRLGFGEASMDAWVGELVSAVPQSRPGITFELANAQFWSLGLDKLRSGELDMLLTRVDDVPEEFESREIAAEELLVALPSGHRLAARDSVSMEDLEGEPWAIFPGIVPDGEGRFALFRSSGASSPLIAQVAPDPSTALLMVRAGIAISPTLASVRDRAPLEGVAYMRLSPRPAPLSMRVVWRRGATTGALATVLDIASTLSAEHADA